LKVGMFDLAKRIGFLVDLNHNGLYAVF